MMEAMLRQSEGQRITCELATGTMLMGTIHSVCDGIMCISDGALSDGDLVSVRHVIRFNRVR